jgi:hypothetical protein
MLTVKELREKIMDLDDDVAILIPGTGEQDFDRTYITTEAALTEEGVVIR